MKTKLDATSQSRAESGPGREGGAGPFMSAREVAEYWIKRAEAAEAREVANLKDLAEVTASWVEGQAREAKLREEAVEAQSKLIDLGYL